MVINLLLPANYAKDFIICLSEKINEKLHNQYDAQEILLKIIDEFYKEDPKLIKKFFYGKMETELIWSVCKRSRKKTEKFITISLYSDIFKDLNSALEENLKSEIL